MAGLVQVDTSRIRVGKPLTRDIYDGKGVLLLNQGHVIESMEQLHQLLSRGMYQRDVDPIEADWTSSERSAVESRAVWEPFAEFASMGAAARQATELLAGKHPAALPRLRNLVEFLGRMIDADADACIALVHVYAVEPEADEWLVLYGLLADLLARRLGFDAGARASIVGAALSAHVALASLRDKLSHGAPALRSEQRAIIDRHPALAITALTELGLNDPLWLRAIEQHHERENGSGYPKGLKGTDIDSAARVLWLAERYLALLSRRGYRAAFNPAEAILRLTQIPAGREEHRHVEALLDAISEYPPGCLVRLTSGESALVVRRSSEATPPVLRAVISARGAPYMGSFARDAREPEHRPVQIVASVPLPTVNLPGLWQPEG